VLGASMAGLGAARALSNHYAHVTLVERDDLGGAIEPRKGVPQGSHGHGLLPSGYRILDAYFPGMMAGLVGAGALTGDLTHDVLWYQHGGWKLRADSGLGSIVVSRPLLEHAVCERVRALPNVTLLAGHDVDEPVFDAGSGRVRAARIRNRASGERRDLAADLVVDATGRGSRSPRWLASWGFDEPASSEVRIDVGYASAQFERRPGDLHGAITAVVASTPPGASRLGFVLAAEGGRWTVTVAGSVSDHPPTELDAWRRFARSLPSGEVFEIVKDREPLGAFSTYRFAANRRSHYEKMARFPRGYLVLGDAICSFNPIYAQGMSVALAEAKALDECLAAGDDELTRRFFARAAGITAGPWTIATGEDLLYPQVEGTRPPGFALISRYMARAHRAARKDRVVLKRFFEVASLLAPPTAMMAPRIAWRVLLGGVGKAPVSPRRQAA